MVGRTHHSRGKHFDARRPTSSIRSTGTSGLLPCGSPGVDADPLSSAIEKGVASSWMEAGAQSGGGGLALVSAYVVRVL